MQRGFPAELLNVFHMVLVDLGLWLDTGWLAGL
jgi:hypothetical protein